MKEYKEYKAPKAEVTVFECVDDIMQASSPVSLEKNIGGSGEYVYAGSKSWNDIYNN